MPVFAAPLFAFSLGVAYAWIAGEELARAQGPAFGTRGFALALGFALLVFAPAFSYFVAFEPDWAYAYLVDTARVPSAVDLAVVLASVLVLPVGFLVAAKAARGRRLTSALVLAIPPALLALAALAALFPRLSVWATYAQFHGRFGVQPIAGSPLGYALLWIDGLVAAGVVWTAREIRRLAAASG